MQKDELMRRLWPDTFVEESNLTFNIQQLRKTLGDNARQPCFIETVARRGYRFIAEVNGHSSPAIFESSPATQVLFAGPDYEILFVDCLACGPRHRRCGDRFMVCPQQICRFNNIRAHPVAPFKSEKFATGGIVRAVITPDGKYIAYTSETGGREAVWLRQLETSENIRIVPPTDEQYLGLAISHDGNSLYFVRKTLADPPASAVYRVTTFGGIPVKIVDHAEGNVSLSPDDKQLSFMRCNHRDHDFCSLHIIDTDGKHERRLLTRQRPIRLAGAQFSPDGKSIAFASGQSWNGSSDFRLVRFDLASGHRSFEAPPRALQERIHKFSSFFQDTQSALSRVSDE